MNNCQIRGCRNLEHRCKDCGRVVQTIGLTDDHFPDVRKMTPESTDNEFVDANKMVWISVKDKPIPYDYKEEKGTWVLILHNNHKYDPKIFVAQLGNYDNPKELKSAFGDGYVPSDLHKNVTHWMPLPKLPEE